MEKIRLSKINCLSCIGVFPEERNTPQKILVDLVIHANLEVAAKIDDYRKTIDYQKLVNLIQKTTSESRFKLLEALAIRLCQEVLGDRRIETVEVTVYKSPASLRNQLEQVSVEIVQTRED